MKKTICTLVFVALAGLAALGQCPVGSPNTPQACVTGFYPAILYNYGGQPQQLSPVALKVDIGNSVTGTASITVRINAVITTVTGDQFMPFSTNAPILVGGASNQETVTPTSVSCTTPTQVGTCVITASFANTHGGGEAIASGSFGLQEAINRANLGGGGTVVLDPAVTVAGLTNATVTAATPYANVNIEDRRFGPIQFWNAQPGATTLAAPTTLVNATAGFGVNGANFTGGAYTGSNTYIACISYVDIYGQEGPCSATFTIATSGVATTDQIGFTAPAASTGAVGYTIYITLNGGTYNLAYKVPLATYANGVITGNGVCTLTKLETTTAACAVTNTTYGQTGSGAVVSALTVNTSPIEAQSTVVSTTSVYVPNAGGRTTYVYSPGSHVGTPGVPMAFLPYTISAADATTVPSVLGTVNLPPGFMNFLGRTIEVCGKATTSASTATIGSIQFQWDAIGQNTTGKGVQIGNLGLTPATAFATTAVYTFCEDFQTTATGAGATAGSINTIGGFLNTSGVATAAAGQGASSDPTTGAVASLNLNSETRLNVIYVHTTGTDGTALTLQSLTVKVLN